MLVQPSRDGDRLNPQHLIRLVPLALLALVSPMLSIVESLARSTFQINAQNNIPTSYSSDDLTMGQFPISVIDRNIDELGAETRIRSEEDARAYVDALFEKFRIDEKQLPGLAEFKSRLVQAEFSAVLQAETRIPESLVTQVFNQFMDEWQMPAWTRVSIREVHAFRVNMSLALYPHSVSRLPDGNLPRQCRPVEALYLIYLLHANMGVPSGLRDTVRAGRWPAEDPRTLPSPGAIGLHQSKKSSTEVQRLFEYRAALSAYSAAHPDFRPQNAIEKLFTRLKIE